MMSQFVGNGALAVPFRRSPKYHLWNAEGGVPYKFSCRIVKIVGTAIGRPPVCANYGGLDSADAQWASLQIIHAEQTICRGCLWRPSRYTALSQGRPLAVPTNVFEKTYLYKKGAEYLCSPLIRILFRLSEK